MSKITVLIVDDQELVRQGVRAFLDALDDIEVVAEAGSGREAINLAEQHVPDVVLMDLIMPEMDGVETTGLLKGVSPRSQVIILTSHHDDEHIFPALRNGALSYILKNIKPHELATAIRKAAKSEATLNPKVAARVVREMHGPKFDPNPFTELTDREMQILKLIADGRANAVIANDLTISEKTVKGHVSNILSKLQLKDRTQAAVLAWREGVVRKDN